MKSAPLTRRGFVKNAAMSPLMLSAAMSAEAWAAGNFDPWSNVDPELAAALKKFPQNVEAPNARNLAASRAGDVAGPASKAPELQPRKTTVPGPGGKNVPVLIIDPKLGGKNRPATIDILRQW